jgi:hypothetical protein
MIGWVGASVARQPVAALVILLWPVASQETALHGPNAAITAPGTEARLAAWARDLEAELDAAFLAEAKRDRHVPARPDMGGALKTAGFFAMTRDPSAERGAA